MDYICSEHHSMLITFNSDRKPHGRLSEWAPLPPFAFFCVIHLHSLQGALVLPHSPDHQQLLTQDSHRRPGSRRGHRRETEPAVHLRGVELESAGGSTRSIATAHHIQLPPDISQWVIDAGAGQTRQALPVKLMGRGHCHHPDRSLWLLTSAPVKHQSLFTRPTLHSAHISNSFEV